jgi:hypothetical protein
MIADPEDKMDREWTRIDTNVVSYSRSFAVVICGSYFNS